MTTLLIAEHQDGMLSEQTNRAFTAASALGQPVDILVAGSNVPAVAEAAAGIDGARKVLVAESDALAHQLPEPMAELIVSLAADYTAIVAAATSGGKSTLPRVAAILDVAQISDVTGIVDANTFRRPIYAGNAVQVVQSSDSVKVLTIRTSAFSAAGAAGSAEIVQINVPELRTYGRHVSRAIAANDRPDLGGARVVVSGGRGFGSKEKFDELIVPLADKLGAAIGASRAAVDSGFASNDLQVGQTGKIVAPDLYVACGISGAIQHLAGMTGSKVIVAINKDADAPIFQLADYGLVADLFEALPELTRSL